MTQSTIIWLAALMLTSVPTVPQTANTAAPIPQSASPAPPAAAAVSVTSTRDQLYIRLNGAWTGQLEYRDFQSDKHVALPTWLDIKTSPDGSSLQFTYTYDDGPSKILIEHSTIKIDPANHQFMATSDRDHSSETYQISGLAEPLPAGRVQFALSGKGTENDKPVDVRITITIGRNLYQYSKETRQAAEDFKFRDGYTFTRRNPPQ